MYNCQIAALWGITVRFIFYGRQLSIECRFGYNCQTDELRCITVNPITVHLMYIRRELSNWFIVSCPKKKRACNANAKLTDCVLGKRFRHMLIYVCICTYLRRPLFQNITSKLGIGIATSMFWIGAYRALEKSSLYADLTFIPEFVYSWVCGYISICLCIDFTVT